MNKIRSVLIKYILCADSDSLRLMFITANELAGGLADCDALDPASADVVSQLMTMNDQQKTAVCGFIQTL